jgi:hypothetical protein
MAMVTGIGEAMFSDQRRIELVDNHFIGHPVILEVQSGNQIPEAAESQRIHRLSRLHLISIHYFSMMKNTISVISYMMMILTYLWHCSRF